MGGHRTRDSDLDARDSLDAGDGWIARDSASVWHGFTQMSCYAQNRPIVVERAEGHYLYGTDGRRYLDAISSLWVNTLGHRVPELDAAITEQLGRVAHSTLLGNGNVASIELAEALAPRVPVDKPHFLFASDGAAAVEQALKIAFQFWANQAGSGETAPRQSYLALGGAYHGDTIGSISVGAGGFGTGVFDPLRFAAIRTPGYDDPAWSGKAMAAIDEHHDHLAAIVLEPLVQGAAGIQVTDPESVRTVVAAAQQRGVLVIADEVAVGFGRTGTLFASELCGTRPDLMAIGKGLSAGYIPLAATAASSRVYEAFLGPDLSEKTFYHGHSYSGNALACAVASRHLKLIDEWQVLANVRERAGQIAKLLSDQIEPLAPVRAVRQRGLMVGVELAPPSDDLRWGRRVCAAAVDRGVLLRPLGDVVVLMPPLTITQGGIDTIVSVLGDAIVEVTGQC